MALNARLKREGTKKESELPGIGECAAVALGRVVEKLPSTQGGGAGGTGKAKPSYGIEEKCQEAFKQARLQGIPEDPLCLRKGDMGGRPVGRGKRPENEVGKQNGRRHCWEIPSCQGGSFGERGEPFFGDEKKTLVSPLKKKTYKFFFSMS